MRLQTVAVRHADSGNNGSDDADKALIGPTKKKIAQVRRAVELFVRGSVNGPMLMPGETADGFGRKNVRVDHVATKVGHEADR